MRIVIEKNGWIEMNLKQVIVMRRDLKMRRGKEIAQGSHAAMAFITRQLQHRTLFARLFGTRLRVSPAAQEWLDKSFAKVTVRVDSEEELLRIADAARQEGLECHVITDSGRTEFAGVPTVTCLAIGPDESEKIDKVTGDLELY